MNHSSMTAKGRIIALLALLTGAACSCTGRTPTEVEKLRKNQFVSEDVFLSITNGSSFADVRKTLGSAMRHQFTVAESGHTWTLISCFLHTGEEESYRFYQLLLRDDALVKTIGNVNWGVKEEVPYRGTTASRVKPWDIEDMTGVRKVIAASALTHEQIRAELKDARETMEKYKGNGNIPAAVGYIFALALTPGYNKEFLINEGLRQRYDGCRTSIGMAIKEVDALYGEPLRVFTTKTGRVARIYGDHRYSGDVDHFLIFSYVAVLFDPEGHVANIYSYGFFCNDWDPGMPSGRRD